MISWMSISANPEHRNVKDSVKKPTFMWTDMQKLRNVGTPKRSGNNRLFLFVPASRNTTSVTSNFSLMQMERGGYLKSPHLAVWCIWLNINILQGSLANYVRTEPIFVSDVKLYRSKQLIINTLHYIQLLQYKLGL